MPGMPPPPTPEQQRLIARIAAQRQRLRALRRAPPPDHVDPADPLPLRLWSFARLHPTASAAALAALALAGGPRRLSRWAGVVLPIVLRMRR